jgi:hypothetical protein
VSTASNDVDEIRRQMAQIRRDLHEDVQGVVATAGAVTDWRRYVTGYSWVALGAAFAVGYFVVPRRRGPEVGAATAISDGELSDLRQTLEELKGQAGPRKRRKSLVGAALGLVTPLVLRLGQGYAMSYLENWIAEQQARHASAGPGPMPGGARPSRPSSPYRPGGPL